MLVQPLRQFAIILEQLADADLTTRCARIHHTLDRLAHRGAQKAQDQEQQREADCDVDST